MPNPTLSLWRCCLTGEAKKPKLKKGAKDVKQNGEANHDTVVEKKKDGLDLEYHDSVDAEPTTSTPAPPKTIDENESGYNDSTAADESSVTPSDSETSTVPMKVQVVEEGSDSKQQMGEIGSGGRIHLACKHDKKSNKIHIKISKIEFGPYQDWKMQDLEVSCMLLPMHQQSFRRRSKRFNDPIAIQLPKNKLSSSSIRFRIYDHKAITRKYLIGQGHVGVESLCPSDGSEVNVILDLNSPDTYGIDTRYITDVRSVGDAAGDSARPEMLISLEYRALTRKLIVEIIKTRGLGLLSSRKPQDVGVEIKLIGKDKQVLRNCRTSLKKHVIDTEFNEMFMFRLNVERLQEVTLQFCVIRYTDIRNKKEMIGEICFGLGSSGIEQQEHWDSLSRSDGKTEYRWHPLYKWTFGINLARDQIIGMEFIQGLNDFIYLAPSL